MPTAEERNTAALRRFQKAVGSGDPDVIATTIDELADPDVLIRSPLPIQSPGGMALKKIFARPHRAFPDLHVAIEDLVAEGDRVLSRNFVTGAHLGQYVGLPGTSRTVGYDEIADRLALAQPCE